MSYENVRKRVSLLRDFKKYISILERENSEMKPIAARKTQQEDVVLDPQGYFVIKVDATIRVEFYTYTGPGNVKSGGRLERVFYGKRADALCDTITRHIKSLLPEHYCYLGRELQKAEDALGEGKTYVQGGC